MTDHLIQEGPRDAKIMVVTDAPHATDLARGKPLQAGAGDIFSRMLDRVGIKRHKCFVTSLCHVSAPKDDFAWFYKKANQLHYIRGVLQLKKDIETIRPNVVVGLGEHTLKALTGKTGIDKWRGSILEAKLVKGQKVVCTHDPHRILKIYDYKAVAEFDLHRVREESLDPCITLPRRDHNLHPDPLVRSRLVEEMSHAEWLGIDIECWPNEDGTWRLACVGFSDDAERSLVIHCDSADAMLAIRRLCACPAKKVYQNGSFDVTVLTNEGIECTNFAWDTMLAHHARFPECAGGEDELSKLGGKKRKAALAKGLAFQTSIYTREPYYKDDAKLSEESKDLKLFWLYNGRDVSVTREIRDVQERELSEFGTRNVFQRRMDLIEPTLAATRRGIKIDLGLRATLRSGIEEEIGRLQHVLDTMAGESVNVKSWPQVRALIYDKLKLPVQYKRGTNTVTSDKDALNDLALKHNHPALTAILKIRERRDLIERYLDTAIDADGRMRCAWDITGTRTGRLSSRVSLSGSGTNLQNIPVRKPVGEAIRRMFIADEGKCFIVRDYSQAEVWIVAHLAECQRLIELLTDPSRDIHRETAAGIFGRALGAVTDIERFLAKRTVHSSNYGVGGEHLAAKVNEDAESTGIRINAADGDRIIAGYFMMYPEIKEVFWAEVIEELRRTRSLTSPLGMKREFYGRPDFKPQSKYIREALAQNPQSTVGELGGMSWVRAYHNIEKACPKTGTNILLNVHDSLMAQCYVDQVLQVADMMAEAMTIPVTIKGKTFTIPTDFKIGLNWGKASSENPNGLRDWTKGGREWLNSLG